MTSPLGVLLLSCVRHQRTYAEQFAARLDARIVAVADEPNIPSWMHEVNQRFADRYAVPYLRDVATALQRSDVAVVSVCSEPTRHARLATWAARARKHVWVDKPMATTAADADALIAAVEAAAVKLSYVHRLHTPAIQYARRCLDRGDIGLPQALHLSFVSTGNVTSGAVEDFQLVVDSTLSGGGELMNFLGYPVDTVRYLTGQDVTRVYVSAGTYFFAPHREHGVEDFGVVFLTLARGIIATVVVGRAPTPNHPTGGDYTLRLHGSAGTLIVDENRPVVTIHAEPPAPPARSGQSLAEATIAPLVDEFMTCIREDRQPLRTMHDGRAAIAVIEAAYRSLASGRVESVATLG